MVTEEQPLEERLRKTKANYTHRSYKQEGHTGTARGGQEAESRSTGMLKGESVLGFPQKW